jgi:hypothetical protein
MRREMMGASKGEGEEERKRTGGGLFPAKILNLLKT